MTPEVDIAALARVHGPRCVQVAVELLGSKDGKLRRAAAVALLGRGWAVTITQPMGKTESTSTDLRTN